MPARALTPVSPSSGATILNDFWRLASSTVRALRERARRHAAQAGDFDQTAAYDADAKRLYARFNLVLADQAACAVVGAALGGARNARTSVARFRTVRRGA